VDNELDWSLVYPELAGVKGPARPRQAVSDSQGMLSQDAMLKDAKIDGELMSSLGNSIKKFESAAKVLLQQLNLWLQQKYSEELTMAEALNTLYIYAVKVHQEMRKSMKKFLKIT
jgi:hypothetical protein